VPQQALSIVHRDRSHLIVDSYRPQSLKILVLDDLGSFYNFAVKMSSQNMIPLDGESNKKRVVCSCFVSFSYLVSTALIGPNLL
jgi:hypothetical protein